MLAAFAYYDRLEVIRDLAELQLCEFLCFFYFLFSASSQISHTGDQMLHKEDRAIHANDKLVWVWIFRLLLRVSICISAHRWAYADDTSEIHQC